MQTSCPSEDQLKQLNNGSLANELAAEISQHLDICCDCLEAIEKQTLDHADSLLLIASRGELSKEAEAEYREAETAIGQLTKNYRGGILPRSVDAEDEGASARSGQIIGSYRLQELIGQGGMGFVYRAIHTSLQKQVAIKLLNSHQYANSEVLTRFQREMRAVGGVDHPHVVRALDAGEVDGQHFLVMEYVPGPDFSRLVKSLGPLSIADACELVYQAAVGLQAIHSNGMVHRDIKPSNLILAPSDEDALDRVENPTQKMNSDPHVKILDLGLALLDDAFHESESPATHTGQIVGTLEYMAPEQLTDSHSVAHQADIYSLGATLYKLLCGESPFPRQKYSSFTSHLSAVVTTSPAAIRDVASHLPESLCCLVEQLLERDPAKRPASAAEVAKRLKPFRVNANLRALLEVSQDCPPAEPNADSHETKLVAYNEDRGSVGRVSKWLAVGLACTLALLFLLASQSEFFAPGKPEEKALVGSRTNTPPVEDDDVATPVNPDAENEENTVVGDANDPPEAGPSGAKNWYGWPVDAPAPAISPFQGDEAKGHQEAWARYLKVPVVFTNSIGIKFRLIPPGEFQMGNSPEFIRTIEMPPQQIAIHIGPTTPDHPVVLTQPYYISLHETTQSQFMTLLDELPKNQFVQGDAYPVCNADPQSIAKFCNAMSELESLPQRYRITEDDFVEQNEIGYRLPTEAQWEFACLAGKPNLLSFDSDSKHYAWQDYNSGSPASPSPVGKLLPNPFGLYDMHGNVNELCGDYFDAEFYGRSGNIKSVNPTGPVSGDRRVVRGGHFTGNIWEAALRHDSHPQGFRVCLPVQAVSTTIGRKSGKPGRG